MSIPKDKANVSFFQVASRSVFMTAGVILVLGGTLGKFGAVLSLIPDPVIGGTLTVLFGMVSAVGISTLKFIDMSSSRNLTIMGVSLLIGLMVPQYVNDPKNADAIKTGTFVTIDCKIHVYTGICTYLSHICDTAKSIDSCQPAQFAQADMSLYFLFFKSPYRKIVAALYMYTRTKKKHRVHRNMQHDYFIAWPRITKIGQIDVLFAVTRSKMKRRVTYKDYFKNIA